MVKAFSSIKVLGVATLYVLLTFSACNQGHQHSHDDGHDHTHVSEDLPPIGSFGEAITKDNAIELTEVMGLIAENETVEVKVKGSIKEVCQHTGCWLSFDFGDGEEILVRMKDHDFYVPMDAAGKTAWVEGLATREMISVAMLKHYAEDAGRSQEEIDAITEPALTYTLEAKGVIIE